MKKTTIFLIMFVLLSTAVVATQYNLLVSKKANAGTIDFTKIPKEEQPSLPGIEPGRTLKFYLGSDLYSTKIRTIEKDDSNNILKIILNIPEDYKLWSHSGVEDGRGVKITNINLGQTLKAEQKPETISLITFEESLQGYDFFAVYQRCTQLYRENLGIKNLVIGLHAKETKLGKRMLTVCQSFKNQLIPYPIIHDLLRDQDLQEKLKSSQKEWSERLKLLLDPHSQTGTKLTVLKEYPKVKPEEIQPGDEVYIIMEIIEGTTTWRKIYNYQIVVEETEDGPKEKAIWILSRILENGVPITGDRMPQSKGEITLTELIGYIRNPEYEKKYWKKGEPHVYIYDENEKIFIRDTRKK